MAKRSRLTTTEQIALYQALYTKISRATAEVDGNRQIFHGKICDLFGDVTNKDYFTTRFLWAVSHKTEFLPTVLFNIINHGVNGFEISRVHSGFYDDNHKHIVGYDLIPYIMKSATLYKATPNKSRGVKKAEILSKSKSQNELKLSHEIEISLHNVTELSTMSDDALAYFGKDAQERYDKAAQDLKEYQEELQRREQRRQDQLRLQDVLELMGMNRDQLKDLLK